MAIDSPTEPAAAGLPPVAPHDQAVPSVESALQTLPPTLRHALTTRHGQPLDTAAVTTGLAARAAEAVDTLAGEQRRLLELREVRRLSYAEIAAETGRSVVDVERVLLEARWRFRRTLEALCVPSSGERGCDWVLARLAAEVDGELSPAKQAGLAQHVAVCDSCRQALDELRSSSPLYALARTVANVQLVDSEPDFEFPLRAPDEWPGDHESAPNASRAVARKALVGAAVAVCLIGAAVWGLQQARPDSRGDTPPAALAEPTQVTASDTGASAPLLVDVQTEPTTVPTAAIVSKEAILPTPNPTVPAPTAVPQPVAVAPARPTPVPTVTTNGAPPANGPSGGAAGEPLRVGTWALVKGDGAGSWVLTPSVALNVRAEPSTEARLLGSQRPGAALELLGGPVPAGEADFYPVRQPGGAVGWVAPAPADLPPDALRAWAASRPLVAEPGATAFAGSVSVGSPVRVLAVTHSTAGAEWARIQAHTRAGSEIEGYLPSSALAPAGLP